MKFIKQSELNKAVEILKDGGLVAFPTETVFGLGVIYDQKKSYEKLILTKRRPPEKPFTLMCADVEDIYNFAYVNETAKKIINRFMPGQLTIILKAKESLPSWCVSKEGTVGIRIPDLDLIRNLIRGVGKPLLVPSANKSGEKPATSSNQVKDIFDNEIDAVIEGTSISNVASTILLIEDNNLKLIREGIISLKDIRKELDL